jgi:hypothetical protein
MVAVGLVMAAGLFGGCSSDVSGMAADDAWAKLKKDQQDAIVGDTLFKGDHFKQAADNAMNAAQAEARSGTISAKAIDEMTEEMSQFLVAQLPKLVADQQYQAVLYSGEFLDRTPSQDGSNPYIASSLDSVVVKLQENQQFTDSFFVVDQHKNNLEKVLQEVSGNVNTDPRRRTSGPTKLYSPDFVYVLTGSFVSLRDDNQHTLDTKMTIWVTHAQSRQQSLVKEFRRHFVFHPGKSRFVSDQENESLRAEWAAKQAGKK